MKKCDNLLLYANKFNGILNQLHNICVQCWRMKTSILHLTFFLRTNTWCYFIWKDMIKLDDFVLALMSNMLRKKP